MLSTATAASTASGTHAADPTTAKPRASLQRAGNTAKQPGGAGGAGGGPVLHQQHHQQVQQHLQQQQQLLLRNPMHRQLWPHCEEQMAKMPALIGRLMTWRAVVEETLAYLKALEALETEVAKANGKLANQLLQLSSTSLLGMSWDSYQPLQKLIQQTSDGQMVFTRTMAETVMKRLQDLRTTITKKVKVCKQEFTRLNAHISKDRTATVQAISVHEKAKARKMVVNSANATHALGGKLLPASAAGPGCGYRRV
ncbi:hypothetical protein DFJ73DRAFT_535591 [Zopfochytrium polystomum]|nr:hypothetical protein DFJ73DRAFT_535591 [Zopfochytrium polystomum]